MTGLTANDFEFDSIMTLPEFREKWGFQYVLEEKYHTGTYTKYRNDKFLLKMYETSEGINCYLTNRVGDHILEIQPNTNGVFTDWNDYLLGKMHPTWFTVSSGYKQETKLHRVTEVTQGCSLTVSVFGVVIGTITLEGEDFHISVEVNRIAEMLYVKEILKDLI